MRHTSRKRNKTVTPRTRGITVANTLIPKRKILVVDDDPVVRDVFKIIFEKEGYEVDMKEDGSDLLKNNFRRPDLFLIDKLLSGVNGLDICRHLKSQKSTQHIPVVMISASPGIAIQSQQAGADDYVEKPFELEHLLRVIQRNLSVQRNESRALS